MVDRFGLTGRRERKGKAWEEMMAREPEEGSEEERVLREEVERVEREWDSLGAEEVERGLRRVQRARVLGGLQ